MVWHTQIITKLYPVYSLPTIYKCQTIPWVQFGYDLRTSNHTLGNVNIGYGLAVTPVKQARTYVPNLRTTWQKIQAQLLVVCTKHELPLQNNIHSLSVQISEGHTIMTSAWLLFPYTVPVPFGIHSCFRIYLLLVWLLQTSSLMPGNMQVTREMTSRQSTCPTTRLQ